MKNLLIAILAIAPLLPASGRAASEVAIPADNLSAECRGGDAAPSLIVFRGEDSVYQTTPYNIPYNADDCFNHQRHIQAMFNAAADAKTKISFRPSGNSPMRDFKIAGGGAAAVPSSGLSVKCVGAYWKRLLVEDADEKTIYETKEYSIPYNDDDCYRAVDQVQAVINSAKALGKKVDIRFSGTPKKDFEVSDDDAQAASRPRARDVDRADDSKYVNTAE